jgi:hypothetical protein
MGNSTQNIYVCPRLYITWELTVFFRCVYPGLFVYIAFGVYKLENGFCEGN